MTDNPHWRRLDAVRGENVTVTVDGAQVQACAGETLAVAMLAAGSRFDQDRSGAPRAPLCNMGTCFECVATVNGRAGTRTCLVPARDGSIVETRKRL